MLTPHCSAASGMVVPPSMVPTTRLRKSSEYGFAIHAGLLPADSLNHVRAAKGIPDSVFSGNALISVLVALSRQRGPDENLQVESKRPVVDVVQIVLDPRPHFFDGIRFATKSIHLGPAGNPGLYIVTSRQPRDLTVEHLVVRNGVRARSDQRHVPSNDVQQLRKLINVRSSQNPSDAGDPGIAPCCLTKLSLVLFGGHGPKLQDIDGLVVETMTDLSEQNRTRRIQLNQRRDDQHEWHH